VEEELTEAEIARQKRLTALRKVIFGIVSRWAWPLALLFVVSLAVFGSILLRRAVMSVGRYTATTKLLYNPRKVSDIETLSDKQIMSILDRGSVKRHIGDVVPMPIAERECLSVDMTIKQARKPTNLFVLTASSQTKERAVKKVNVYAEMLIDEYKSFREKDLETWRTSLEGRRSKLLESLSAVESEEQELKAKTGVMSPQEALLAINALISDLRKNVSQLGVDHTNEDLKKKRLEKRVGPAGLAITENANAIRKRAFSVAALDKELRELREKYTDLNPKVAGKLRERELHMAELSEFLKSKGVEELDVEDLDHMEKVAAELAECIMRMSAIDEKKRALEQEISDNEERAKTFASMIPAFEMLQTKRADVTASIREVDEKMNNITYVIGTLRNDLRQIERTGGAGDKGPFGAKQILLSVAGAGAVTFIAILWTLALELLFGKMRGGREVSCYSEVSFLGSLPVTGILPPDEEREVMGVVALKMFLLAKGLKVSLICRLPGSNMRDDFSHAVESVALMSGVNCFVMDVVSGANFSPPEGSEQMIGAVRQGSHGWFPAINRLVMAPTELQILQADIEALKESYGNIFIRMEGGVRTGGTFFDQLLGICDSVVLVVGAKDTPRSAFAYVRRHVSAAGKPIMAMATDADAKTVREEMEARP
jgi:hypothetical protein